MTAGAIGAALIGLGISTTAYAVLARRGPRPPLPKGLGYRPGGEEAERRLRRLARLAAETRAGRRMSLALASELPRAGIERSAAEFLAYAAGTAVITGIAAGAAGGPVWGLVAAAGTLAAVRLAVHRRARRWALRFDDELPDALDLLAGSVEAGSSMAQAIELVAAEGQPPLSEELARVLADNRLGEPLVDALESAAARIGSEDFAWCVRAIRVQQEFGASLAGVMRTLAQFMRWRQELRREVRSLSAEGRVSAYVLVGLPFALAGFFALAAPDYLALLVTTPLGWMMSIAAAALMAIGTIWMIRVVKVEV